MKVGEPIAYVARGASPQVREETLTIYNAVMTAPDGADGPMWVPLSWPEIEDEAERKAHADRVATRIRLSALFKGRVQVTRTLDVVNVRRLPNTPRLTEPVSATFPLDSTRRGK